MRKILNLFLIAAAIILLSSCNKENIAYPADGKTGTLDMSSIAVTYNTKTVLRSGENSDTQDFIVSIYNAQNVQQGEWKYKEMPEILHWQPENIS